MPETTNKPDPEETRQGQEQATLDEGSKADKNMGQKTLDKLEEFGEKASVIALPKTYKKFDQATIKGTSFHAKYPKEITTPPYQNWVQFVIVKYVKRSDEKFGMESKPIGSISLPFTSQYTPEYSIGYEAVDNKASQWASAVKKGLDTIKNSDQENATETLKKLGSQFAGEVGARLGKWTVQKLLPGALGTLLGIDGEDFVNLAMKRMGRRALHVNKEHVLSNLEFRNFSFEWELTPRNVEEIKSILTIIQAFKYHSLPKYNDDEAKSGSRYLKYPEEWQIDFMYNAEPNRFLPRVSRCVCGRVGTNYTTQEIYRSFEHGEPISVTLSCDFTELEYITKDKVLSPQKMQSDMDGKDLADIKFDNEMFF